MSIEERTVHDSWEPASLPYRTRIQPWQRGKADARGDRRFLLHYWVVSRTFRLHDRLRKEVLAQWNTDELFGEDSPYRGVSPEPEDIDPTLVQRMADQIIIGLPDRHEGPPEETWNGPIDPAERMTLGDLLKWRDEQLLAGAEIQCDSSRNRRPGMVCYEWRKSGLTICADGTSEEQALRYLFCHLRDYPPEQPSKE